MAMYTDDLAMLIIYKSTLTRYKIYSTRECSWVNLYLLYVRDLPTHPSNPMVMYANDLAILNIYKSTLTRYKIGTTNDTFLLIARNQHMSRSRNAETMKFALLSLMKSPFH